MWAGVIPLQDPKEAIKELHRSRELGSKALNVKATPIPGKEWTDPHFDPIFDELEKTNTPIIFHDTKTGSMGHERFADNFFFSHMVGRTIESMICLMVYLCGGVMEKHPKLKIICLETGAVADALVDFPHGRAFREASSFSAVAEAQAERHFQSECLCRLRALRGRLVRMGGGIFRRRSFGARHRLAALGLVRAGTGNRSGSEEHEDISGEQAQGARRECDQFTSAGALTVLTTESGHSKCS
jgi:hypothetical protein